jgi:hypothetical protein
MISDRHQVISLELAHCFAAAQGARCRYRPSVTASGRNCLGQLIPLATQEGDVTLLSSEFIAMNEHEILQSFWHIGRQAAACRGEN